MKALVRHGKGVIPGALTKLIQEGKTDPSFLTTHLSNDLAEGPGLYETFGEKKDGRVKVVFHLN